MPGPNQLDVKREDVQRDRARTCSPCPTGTRTEAGLRHNIRVGRAVYRGLAARAGLRAALQPDGGRGDRGDLARAGLAVAAPRRDARRRARRHGRALPPDASARSCETRARARSATRASPHGRFAEARELFEQLSTRRRVRRVPDPARVRPLLTTEPLTATAYDHPHEPLTGRMDRFLTNCAQRASARRALHAERWAGITRAVHAGDVERLRGSVDVEHTLAQLGARAPLGAAPRRAVRQRARRADRQPGGADGPRRAEGDLPLGLAGRRRRQHRRPDVPGPEPLPGQLACPTVVRRINHALQRADQIEHAEGKARPRLVRADRGRRRGRLRRAAERLRADEGDDRGGRRRRALRGPARLARRSAATWAARCSCRLSQFIRTLDRRAPRRRRAATCPTLLVARTDADGAKLLTSDIDERDQPFITRRAHRRGLLPREERRRRRPSRAASPMRPTPTCSGARRPRPISPRRGASPRASTRSSPASSSPTTARRRSTGRSTSTTPPSPSSSASSAPWATSSSSSRWPASTR